MLKLMMIMICFAGINAYGMFAWEKWFGKIVFCKPCLMFWFCLMELLHDAITSGDYCRLFFAFPLGFASLYAYRYIAI